MSSTKKPTRAELASAVEEACRYMGITECAESHTDDEGNHTVCLVGDPCWTCELTWRLNELMRREGVFR